MFFIRLNSSTDTSRLLYSIEYDISDNLFLTKAILLLISNPNNFVSYGL